MKEQLISNIKKGLSKNINVKRYNHTMGVVEAAIYLAEKYGENTYHAEVAALMHDYAKDYAREQVMDYISKHEIEVDDIMLQVYELLHGDIAASIAKKQFQINNEDIINAIKYHTTGRANMSKLEKIIYLSDFIEEGRVYPKVEELRKTADKDLDQAVLQALNNTMVYVISIEKPLHPNTLYARNEMLTKLKKY